MSGTSELCSEAELIPGKDCWAAIAIALDAYLAGVKAIHFTDQAAPKASALVVATDDFDGSAVRASRSSTTDEFHERSAEAVTSSETWINAEQQLLDALGLPVGP